MRQQGMEFEPSHVFRQLHKLDIAPEAVLWADCELADGQMPGRLVDPRRRKPGCSNSINLVVANACTN
jgi:hypothetical protein